jgi:serine/threonine-protein kinase
MTVAGHQALPLATGGTRYRYYLVWITKLPPGSNSVSLNEVSLYS